MKSALRFLFLGLAVGLACKGKPQIGFDVTVPSGLVSQTVWFEIGAFKGASCSAILPMLGNGIPDLSTKRVAFRRDDPASPIIGDLPSGSYAFASVARDEGCGILASGCTEVDVSKDDHVSIAMSAVDGKPGTCGVAASCEAARCVPANDNANASVGAGCSLELLGAGPLANPVIGAGTVVSTPVIAATPSGFVVAYREIDPQSSNARISILPVDGAGGSGVPARPLLVHCPNADETDGVAIVLNGTDGQIIVARPSCGERPGLELLNFSSKPEVTSENQSHLVTNGSASKITISPSGAASVRAGGNVVAFLEDSVARVSTVTSNGVDKPTGTFGAVSGNTGAWASASDTVLALLAAGPPDDGSGADAGNPDASPSPVSGEDGPQLRLTMVPVTTALDSLSATTPLRPPIVFPGSFGALATRGNRVIVASEGTGPGRSVTYRTFDLDQTQPGETNGFAMEGTDKVTTTAITIQGDRVFFTALKTGVVSLFAYAGASTVPRLVRSIDFSKEPRIPAISRVRDGHVAVAATETRVAVVWTTAKLLTKDDPSGGYAVFACTP